MRNRKELNITDASQGAAITVKIVPKASRTEIVGIQEDGTIKIRLMAPPLEGEANDELIDFLAKFLEVQSGDIEILAGANNRRKLVTVLNIRAEEVEARVRAAAIQTEGFVGDDD